MSDEKKTDGVPSAPETEEPSPLQGRPFDPIEAIARENAGALKGASPVARSRQLLAEIEDFLESHLVDPDGALLRTLLARLQENAPLLGRHHARPLGALAELLDRILGSDTELHALVRDADARWGREYQERPHFESDDAPPHPADPYTRRQVRERLAEVAARIGSD